MIPEEPIIFAGSNIYICADVQNLIFVRNIANYIHHECYF